MRNHATTEYRTPALTRSKAIERNIAKSHTIAQLQGCYEWMERSELDYEESVWTPHAVALAIKWKRRHDQVIEINALINSAFKS